MNTYNWDFPFPESFFKLQETLKELSASILTVSSTWKTVIQQCDFGGVYKALNNYVQNYEFMSTQVAQISSALKSLQSIYDTAFYASAVNTQTMKSVLKSIDWSWIAQAKEDEAADGVVPVAEELVTQEIRAEMAEDITQVLSNPEEIQSVSRSKYLQWKERNPGIAAFFLDILYPLLLVLIGALVSQGLARLDKNSQVYAEPTATSNVVYNLTVENNITIIGDAPYYYEVEFTNSETGESITGYVYKGNITVEEQTETEGIEEGAATEVKAASSDTTTSQTGQGE